MKARSDSSVLHWKPKEGGWKEEAVVGFKQQKGELQASSGGHMRLIMPLAPIGSHFTISGMHAL